MKGLNGSGSSLGLCTLERSRCINNYAEVIKIIEVTGVIKRTY